MGDLAFASNPTDALGGSLPKQSDVGGFVTLGSRFLKEKLAHPLPAAAPAPLITDGGIADGQPASTTGLKFIPWTNLDAFNYQGNFMAAAGTPVTANFSLNPGALGQNQSTPRRYAFGTFTGEPLGSTLDFRFMTDSTRVIPVWVNFTGYSGTAYTDMHMMVEHEGQMKHLSSNNTVIDGLPRTQSSTGSGVKRRELLFSDRRMRRMRAIMPGLCYFAGVWIDTLATIRKTPNLDLYMHNGDSWNEPNNASFSDNPGGGMPSGSYMCLGLPQYLSFETGAAHGSYAQGGTGEANANGTSNTASTYAGTDGPGSSMWTDSRVNDIVAKFGPQFPIELDIGSKNDGNLLGTPYKTTYKARMQARITKLIARSVAAGREIKVISVGIQPADWTPGDGSPEDLSEQGQAEVPALFPGVVLGFVSIKNMWDAKSTSGQRSILCLAQGGLYLHLNVSGYISVAGHIAAGIAPLTISANYLQKTRTA